MAKKQLKKLNQPKKYLQGGSNMGSLSMMRQNPYYLGQVNQDAAQEDFATTQEQLMQTKENAVQAKKDAEAQKKAEMDQSIRSGAGKLIEAGAADKKAGNLGKLFTKTPTPIGNPNPFAFLQAPAQSIGTGTAIEGVGVLAPEYMPAAQAGLGTAADAGVGVLAPEFIVPAAENTTNIASTAGQTTAGLSNLATAGIGVAANVGGRIIKNRTNDDDAYTFTDKERKGNVGGSALSSAGTGFGIGATVGSIVPGVGNVVGGLIGAGIGAGVGAIKARKENKAAKEEADRLQRDLAAQRGAFQSAFVNSRLTGADTGFGLNSSTNMNNQFTNSYQVARTGGMTGIQEDRRTKRVPGGKIVPIEGTDAVEFIGRSHEKGGVTIDKNTEVEGGETMDQVNMNNNNKQDYIFSKYLKLGGKSFAQRHKEILKGNGSQAEIQRLAAMQEEAAGRNPQQVARYGGIHKYVDGGLTDPPENTPGSGSYQQVGKFGAPDLTNAKLITVNGPSGSRYQVYQLPDGSTYDPNNMGQAIKSVKDEGAAAEANLFALPGAAAKGVTSGLAGISRMAFNAINDKALPAAGGNGSMGALPAGNTSAVGNYGGNVFAAKPPSESFNVFGNIPGMIKGAGTLSASGAQPQSQGSSDNYTGPTGQGEGQQYFNNIGKDQGQGQNQGQNQGQSDPYNTAANAEKMGWGNDVQGYIKSGFTFNPTLKSNAQNMGWGNDFQGYINSGFGFAPKKDGAGKKSGAKPYDRDAWRDKGVSLMTDEELTAEGLGPKDSIPEGAQYRKAPGVQPPAAAGTAGQAPADITGTFRDNGDGTFSYGSDKTGWETSTDKNVAKSKFQTKQVNAAGAQTTAGSTGYVAPAGVAGSAPNAQTGPVSTAGQTIVAGNPPSNAPTGTQSNVSSQTVTGTGAPAAGTTGTTTTTTTTGAAASGQNPAVTGQNNPTAGTTGTAGNAPTINNQNTKFQYTATGAGNLDYSDRNTAGGIWKGDRYEKEWKPLVASTMDDPIKAQQVIDYLTNYTGTDADDVKAKIKGKSTAEQIKIIKNLATDTKVGPFHNAVLDGIKSTEIIPDIIPDDKKPTGDGSSTEVVEDKTVTKKEPCGPGTYLSSDGSCQPVPPYKEGNKINGSLMAGLGQLVPVGAALLNPYKIAPGISGAPSIKGPLMPRMNLNQERASAIQQNVAFKNAVLGQNAGPGALAAMQSANTKTNQQMLQIGKQEQDQNKQLAAQEGSLAMDASRFNAESDQKRQMFNTEFNQKERQYRREDILGALDAGASRIAGIVKDERSYKANERLARALDETHSYDRFSIYEQLTKQAKQKNSPYNGVSDAELRRMAAGISEQIYGEMGVVAEAPAATTTTQTARTGGVRQYVSRLGELKSARATKAKL